MKTVHKRLKHLLLTVLIIILCSPACADQSNVKDDVQNEQPVVGSSVHFIDVGNGDCIFARFNDGKVLLIDCGDKDERIQKTITDYLKAYGVTKIDFFVLTHPNVDHIGNASEIINEFEIGKVFIPKIKTPMLNLFAEYSEVVKLIEQKQIPNEYSDSVDYIKGNGYAAAFLSPLAVGGSYDDFHSTADPTENQINNLSPIIYLTVNGVRFVFTGDAGKKEEATVIDNYQIGYYKACFNKIGIDVNLDGVDFLKVAHHGADDGTSADFANLLAPKNAVISVGGDNKFGHPSTNVIARLTAANQQLKLYRTDVLGSISVTIEDNGTFNVKTQA